MFKVGDIVRFGTKKEFVEKYGPKWREELAFGFAPNMDFMLGKGFEVLGVIKVPFDDSYVYSIEGHSDIIRTYVSDDMIRHLQNDEEVEMLEGYKLKTPKFNVGDIVRTKVTEYSESVLGMVVFVEPFPREDDDMIYLVHSKEIVDGVDGRHMASPYSALAAQDNRDNFWYTSDDLTLVKGGN